MPGLTPYLIIGGLVASIASFGGGVMVGKDLTENGYFKAQQKADEKREQVIRQAQTADTAAAAQDVRRVTTFREIIREVPKVIDRPVYRNVCNDDDGVRQLQRAVEAANGRAPGSGIAREAGRIQSAVGEAQPADR